MSLPRGSAVVDPIIPTKGMGGMGRVAPGTQLLVRRATDEELSVQWGRLHRSQTRKWNALTVDPANRHYEPNPDYRLQANAFLVCWADDPTQVLHSWWSPAGHWLLEYAIKEARTYAARRGAEYIGLHMPQLWQDEGDQA